MFRRNLHPLDLEDAPDEDVGYARRPVGLPQEEPDLRIWTLLRDPHQERVCVIFHVYLVGRADIPGYVEKTFVAYRLFFFFFIYDFYHLITPPGLRVT